MLVRSQTGGFDEEMKRNLKVVGHRRMMQK